MFFEGDPTIREDPLHESVFLLYLVHLNFPLYWTLTCKPLVEMGVKGKQEREKDRKRREKEKERKGKREKERKRGREREKKR